MVDDTRCPICLEPMSDTAVATMAPCSHTCHVACAHMYITENRFRTCFLCRTVLHCARLDDGTALEPQPVSAQEEPDPDDDPPIEIVEIEIDDDDDAADSYSYEDYHGHTVGDISDDDERWYAQEVY